MRSRRSNRTLLGVPSACFGRRNTAPERRATEVDPHRSPLLLFYPYVSGEQYKWDKVTRAKTKSKDKVSESEIVWFRRISLRNGCGEFVFCRFAGRAQRQKWRVRRLWRQTDDPCIGVRKAWTGGFGEGFRFLICRHSRVHRERNQSSLWD